MLRRNESLFDRVFGSDFDRLFNSTYFMDDPIVDYKKSDKNKTVYLKNGMVHNENGPAITYKDGKESEYWLEGRQVTKFEVDSYRQKLEDEKDHYIDIGERGYVIKGKQYRELKSILDKMTEKT